MRTLIIGAGAIGLRHAQILRELNIEVNFITKRTDLDFKYYPEIIHCNVDSYDYFIISNETSKHFDTLKGLVSLVDNKIILIENPLFSKKNILDIKNNKCYVGYNLRFHPMIQMVKEAATHGGVLSIELLCSHYLPDWNRDRDYRETYSAKIDLGGGVLKDLTHEIDLLYYILPCRRVKMNSSTYMKISDLDIETNDFFRADGFMGDAYFSVGLDYISRVPRRNIAVYTNTDTILGDLISGVIVRSRASNEKRDCLKVSRNHTYREMHKAILFKQGLNACDFDGGMKILRWWKD